MSERQTVSADDVLAQVQPVEAPPTAQRGGGGRRGGDGPWDRVLTTLREQPNQWFQVYEEEYDENKRADSYRLSTYLQNRHDDVEATARRDLDEGVVRLYVRIHPDGAPRRKSQTSKEDQPKQAKQQKAKKVEPKSETGDDDL